MRECAIYLHEAFLLGADVFPVGVLEGPWCPFLEGSITIRQVGYLFHGTFRHQKEHHDFGGPPILTHSQMAPFCFATFANQPKPR